MSFGLASYIEERRKWVDEIPDRRPPILSGFLLPSTRREEKYVGKDLGKDEAKEKITNLRLLGLKESKGN